MVNLKMHNLLENSFLLSTIYIGIVNNFFVNISRNQPIKKFELVALYSQDSNYIERWLDCAYSNDLVYFDDEKIILTENGKNYVLGTGCNYEIIKVLRAVYNIIIVNKSIEIFNNDQERKYSIIFCKEFKYLTPYYKMISNETHRDVAINYVISNPKISSLLYNSRIVDYGCGDGWFLELLKSKFPNNHFIGIDGEALINSKKKSVYEFIQNNHEIPYFDVIFLNRVLHHLGEKRKAILSSIVNKMNKNAHIVVWEFNWQGEESKKNREMAFLNLIEHIQGNTFLKLEDVQSEFNQLGLRTEHLFINNCEDFILIASK